MTGYSPAVVDDSTTLSEITAAVERRVRWKGQPVRALHPFDPDGHALFASREVVERSKEIGVREVARKLL